MTDYVKPGIAIGCIALIKFTDLTDPDTILYARIAFACGTITALLLLGFLYLRIQSKNDQRLLVVQESDINPNYHVQQGQSPSFSQLLGGQPDSAGKPVETTNQHYDLLQLRQLLKPCIMTPIIVTLLHLYWGFVPPLILQSLMNVATISTSELFRIYVLGASDKSVQRPFKPAPGFGKMFRELKKEMANASGQMEGKNERKNKKLENKKKVGKAS